MGASSGVAVDDGRRPERDQAESPDADSRESFEAFYRSHLPRVYRALAVTLGNPALAQEAADEAMARAFAHWRRVRQHDNPGGWAYRVGLNWATSWWRRVRRETPLVDQPHHPAAPPDPAATAALDALALLAVPQRAVVVCRVLLELSTHETAVVLGVAEGTVKSRLARALATLRRQLDEQATEKERP